MKNIVLQIILLTTGVLIPSENLFAQSTDIYKSGEYALLVAPEKDSQPEELWKLTVKRITKTVVTPDMRYSFAYADTTECFDIKMLLDGSIYSNHAKQTIYCWIKSRDYIVLVLNEDDMVVGLRDENTDTCKRNIAEVINYIQSVKIMEQRKVNVSKDGSQRFSPVPYRMPAMGNSKSNKKT